MDQISKYFPILLSLSPLILFWQQTRTFTANIFRLFWKRKNIPYDYKVHFYKKLQQTSWCLDLDNYRIHEHLSYSIKYGKCIPFLFKINNFQVFFYKKFIPIFVIGDNENQLIIRYLKGTFPFEKFIADIVPDAIDYLNNQNDEDNDRFNIEKVRGISLKSKYGGRGGGQDMLDLFPPSKSSNNERYGESSSSNISTSAAIFWPHEIIKHQVDNTLIPAFSLDDVKINNTKYINKNKYIFTEQGNYILNVVTKWLKAEYWYQERGIRWYRSVILYGQTGQGKSTLILEIAKRLKIPIWVFDLSTMDNQELENNLSDLSSESGIVLFEDIDLIWEGRKIINTTDNGINLTFDCFINQLSGVNAIKNKFIFITTNHIEKLDPALIRDGRVDERIELLPLNIEEKTRMASILLENDLSLVSQIVEDGKNDSTAQFENRVIKKCLDLYWDV